MTEQQPDLGELISQIADAYNREITQFDDLVQELEDSRVENMELARMLKTLNDGAEQVQKNAQGHMDKLNQALIEKHQMADKLDMAQIQIKLYKELGTPKKIREQIKSYKAKAAENLKSIASLKADIKSYRKHTETITQTNKRIQAENAQQNITTLWSEGGDHLLLFPAPLTMSVNGKPDKQVTLLFMDGSGCGKLIGLDEDQHPIVCSMPKGGLKPKAKTLDKAGAILRLFKKQNWRVTHDDLVAIKSD